MALFDTVKIHPSLIPDAPKWMRAAPWFQTYDLGQGMSDYAFEESGAFVMDRHMFADVIGNAFGVDPESLPKVPVKYKRKRLEMWFSDPKHSTNVVVQIRDGRFSSLRIE